MRPASELGGRSAQPTWVVATSSWAQIGFVGRNSPLLPLCDDLGLGDDVVAARAGAVAVWSRGHLRRLPAGLITGMPVRLGPLLRSRLLSPRELLRAGFDFVLPQTRCETDLSIVALIGGRMGRGVRRRRGPCRDPLGSLASTRSGWATYRTFGRKRTRPGRPLGFGRNADGVGVGVKYLVADIANRVNNHRRMSGF